MTYKVIISGKANKQLKKLDPNTARIILNWIGKNLQGTVNPYFHGKALSADLAGLWRYRVLDYRLICLIEESTVTIDVLLIGHRRDIYSIADHHFSN